MKAYRRPTKGATATPGHRDTRAQRSYDMPTLSSARLTVSYVVQQIATEGE